MNLSPQLLKFASLLFVCSLFSACGPQVPVAKTPVPNGVTVKEDTELIFSVATSAKDVMEALTAEYTKQTGIVVQVNPGSTNSLANQIIEGAPVDLFLSANQSWAEKVSAAKEVASKQPLLTNRLVLVVPKGNPAEVHQPADLLKPAVKMIALAGENVPAGIYSNQALTKLELLTKLTGEGKIARGQDVRNTLSFVERGEAEAGIVYSTDVALRDKVEEVYSFDPALHDEIVYVLLVFGERNRDHANSFFLFLSSPEASEIYSKYGFSRIASRGGEMELR